MWGSAAWGVAVVCLSLWSVAGTAGAAFAEEPPLFALSPAEEELQSRLATTVGVEWKGLVLRDALERLGQSHQITLWLDRRVDPDQEIEFASQGRSLEATLRLLADRLKLGLGLVGPVVYFGPRETADSIGTVAAVRRYEAAGLPALARGRLSRTVAAAWPTLAEPRRLAADLLAEGGVEPSNLETLPHDLWPARRLPPLAWSDRLTLILAGFGLTYELSPDGASAKFTAWPAPPKIVLRHPARGTPAEVRERVRSLFPNDNLELQPSASGWQARATYEQHVQLAQMLRGRTGRTVTVGPPQTRYTLRVAQQPLGAVLQALATRMELELQAAPAVAEALQQAVTFEVNEATRDELFNAVVQDRGVAWRIDGQKLIVTLKE